MKALISYAQPIEVSPLCEWRTGLYRYNATTGEFRLVSPRLICVPNRPGDGSSVTRKVGQVAVKLG